MLGFGASGTQRLNDELARVMRRVRKVHERRFYAS
jgi:hypothetical protein